MEIEYYYHKNKIVVEIEPKDLKEREKIIKFIEFAQLNAENKKIKNGDDKERD